MTHEELIKTIKQLSAEDRITVRDAISKIIADEDEPRKTRASIADKLSEVTKPDALSAGRTASAANGHPLSQQLYGILEFEGGPPSDDEVKDMIADYLLKKYY